MEKQITKKEIENIIEKKVEKYFKELINYSSVNAQLIKHITNQNQSIIRLLHDIVNKNSKEELFE